MILLIIILLLSILILGIYVIINNKLSSKNFVALTFIILLSTALGGILTIYDRPSALDVYRGKTVLKVTYIEALPIDSVVVYKESE